MDGLHTHVGSQIMVAEELAAAVDKSGVVFAVTHNYTGYPLVRQALVERQRAFAGQDSCDAGSTPGS